MAYWIEPVPGTLLDPEIHVGGGKGRKGCKGERERERERERESVTPWQLPAPVSFYVRDLAEVINLV
jgi:hypothetical protein